MDLTVFFLYLLLEYLFTHKGFLMHAFPIAYLIFQFQIFSLWN